MDFKWISLVVWPIANRVTVMITVWMISSISAEISIKFMTINLKMKCGLELRRAAVWDGRMRASVMDCNPPNQRNIETYQTKNGNQHNINVPIIIPNVRAALCSRFILIKCLSLVGVWSWSTSFNVSIFDEPDPLNASPEITNHIVVVKYHQWNQYRIIDWKIMIRTVSMMGIN